MRQMFWGKNKTKLLLVAVITFFSLINTKVSKALVPDGGGAILQNGILRCKQAGGIVNQNMDYFYGAIVNFKELVVTGRFAAGPNCWCGLIPTHVLEFKNCTQPSLFVSLTVAFLLFILVVLLYKLIKRIIRKFSKKT